MKMNIDKARGVLRLLEALDTLPDLETGVENANSHHALCIYLGDGDGSIDHEVEIPVALAQPILNEAKRIILLALQEAEIEPDDEA